MKKYGLIGYPLANSFSKKYFIEKFSTEGLDNHPYEPYPLPNLSHLPDLVKSIPDLSGFIVIVPHKIGVMYYLDRIDPAETEFLKWGKAKGASIKNGMEMLHMQAEKSQEI